MRSHASFELTLDKMKERKNEELHLFFTNLKTGLVQAYLIISMDVRGLIDRYSGVDHEYES